VHRELLGALRLAHDPRAGLELVERFEYGDLGQLLSPAVGEVVRDARGGRAVRIAESGPREPGHHYGRRQRWENPAAPRPERVLVFGDSHTFGRIHGRGRLAMLLAETFQETHYAWAPFGWSSPLVAELAPDIVIVETAERFLAKVPALEADLAPDDR
jgi:hypothetical protein